MTTLALFIARLLSIYSFVIWIRILASWINPFPQPGSFTYYLARIVDPYLNTFRSRRFRAGMLDFSPIKGPEGNIEYLIHLSNDQVDERRLSIDPAMISRLVDEAHDELDK